MFRSRLSNGKSYRIFFESPLGTENQRELKRSKLNVRSFIDMVKGNMLGNLILFVLCIVVLGFYIFALFQFIRDEKRYGDNRPRSPKVRAD